ncbi:hypothetical protein PVAP13_5NG095500 [Panicum virgatum]|uniref:Uncharacterized protein n=2 Tax=Panicum virgatum TaxID=38727 RepID=A0A8T0RQA6_PANVG|nr:hypothetical protein PVAP13_5NG095500 [Panicum virgatum]
MPVPCEVRSEKKRIWPAERVPADFLMYFQEYLNLQHRAFVQYYRCLSMSLLNKENIDEDGNWVIMPPSALDRLSRLNVEYPMLFQIKNPSTERVTHCGVHEFVAEEGFIHMPTRLMEHLGVQENELVLVRNTLLPTATFVKLQPHTTDFLDVSHHKELLENNFRKFICLTAGETIVVTEGERRYYLDVLEARPAEAVRTIDTDCAVDFAPPLDYVEPAPAPAPAPGASQANGKLPRFTGVAARMDGKPVEQAPPAPVPVGRQADLPRQPAQFTGVAARIDGKPVELPPPTPSPAAASAGALGAPKSKVRLGAPSAAGSGNGRGVSKAEAAGGKEQEKLFVGTQYSLKD